MLLTRLSRRFFSIQKQIKPTIEIESHTIVEPYVTDDRNLISNIQNWMTNRSVFNDMQRSFKDFNISKIDTRFLHSYNNILKAVEEKNFEVLQSSLSPTLWKKFKKSFRNDEELPYFFIKATSCQCVQARAYSENITMVKASNKWFQLTLKYRLTDGDVVYHIVERNDKAKHFKFIKFFL